MNHFKKLREDYIKATGEKLSQKELARRIGVHENTIQSMEVGKHRPDRLTRVLLARFYKISVEELMGRDGFKDDGRGDPREAS